MSSKRRNSWDHDEENLVAYLDWSGIGKQKDPGHISLSQNTDLE